MAALRRALQRDTPVEEDQGGGGAGYGAPPPVNTPGGGLPTDGQGNRMRPIEMNPGQTPTKTNTPPSLREPASMSGGPAGFVGMGSNTQSPPSVTQPQPFVSLSSPAPESLVFPSGGGGRLFGNTGGQFGGGLGLGDGGNQGASDPSGLIQALMQLIGR